MDLIKIGSIMVIALVVANLIAFALGWISMFFFWIIIIGAALVAFYVVPNIRKKELIKK